MMTNIVGCPQTPEALVLDMPLEVVFEQHERRDLAAPLPPGAAGGQCRRRVTA